MTLDYRRCRQARCKLVRWQRQLLKLVDALEAARVQEGEAVFRKLCASPVIEEASSFQQELTDGSRRLREQQAVGDR